MAEFLLNKGYVVHGVKRRSSSFNTQRLDHLYVDPHDKDARLFLHYGDMTDSTNLIRLIQETRPTEIYNLAAQSHVQVSFESPEYTANADALGTLRLLEAVRILGFADRVRFYQASTSELYGNTAESPQTEQTPVRAPQPLWRGQALCLLDHGQLPGSLWHACLQRHLVQPRGADPWRDVCYAQDQPRRRRHRSGPRHHDPSRQFWMPSATGAMPATTWKASGSSCNRTRPTITSWPPGKAIPCVSSWKSRSPRSGGP